MTLTIPRAPAVMPATVRVPCRPAMDAECPSAALRARTRAHEAGWAVMLTYAAGVEQRGQMVPDDDPESGRSKRRIERPVDVESIALRAASATGRRFLVWERVPGGKWEPVKGYGYDTCTPIHRLKFTGLEW